MAVDEPIVQGIPYGSGGDGGMLPWWLVIPVQLVAMVWELGVVAIVTLPWWSIIASIATFDWILDFVFLYTIGLVCRPCAGIFIWILNIALLPVMILGYIQRLYLETFGLIIDGWMLAFKFSGCYWKFGHHCWHTPRAKHRNMRTLWDIPLMAVITGDVSLADGIVDAFTPPKIESDEHFLEVRAANRSVLLEMLPGYRVMSNIYSLINENVDF